MTKEEQLKDMTHENLVFILVMNWDQHILTVLKLKTKAVEWIFS